MNTQENKAHLREQSIDELNTLEGDLARRLWKARFDNHTGQLDDTGSIQRLRRELARVKTILTERELKKADR